MEWHFTVALEHQINKPEVASSNVPYFYLAKSVKTIQAEQYRHRWNYVLTYSIFSESNEFSLNICYNLEL